jgi:hypothetical protein
MTTNRYYKNTTGYFFSDILSLEDAARLSELEDATEEQVLALGYSKVFITDAPDNGHMHTISAFEERDGVLQPVWVRIREQEREIELVQLAQDMRKERGARLAQCDWTQLADAPLDEQVKQSWGAYRQSLRDLTTQDKFPWRIVWPTPPA